MSNKNMIFQVFPNDMLDFLDTLVPYIVSILILFFPDGVFLSSWFNIFSYWKIKLDLLVELSFKFCFKFN